MNLPEYPKKVVKHNIPNKTIINMWEKARRDPLLLANRIEKIYYVRANPNAAVSRGNFARKKVAFTAVRYAFAAGIWGFVGLAGAYYIIRPDYNTFKKILKL